MARFKTSKQMDLMELIEHKQKMSTKGRQRFGLRFLKKHEVAWLTSAETLRRQVSLSLADRCKHFQS